MVNISNYKQEIGKLLRDVLRGVDSNGDTNAYTTVVHHPKDYESDRTTLKDSSEWIDPRTWIIVGKKKKPENGPTIAVEPVDVADIAQDAQGSTSYDFTGGIWQIQIDLSAAKVNQRSWRDRISAQVLNTLTSNKDIILENNSFVKVSFTVNSASDNDNFIDVVQANIDGTLED